MIEIKLDKNSAEDVSLIMKLKKMGVSDETIQKGYNNTIKQRSDDND